jgi:hypothetical protein
MLEASVDKQIYGQGRQADGEVGRQKGQRQQCKAERDGS